MCTQTTPYNAAYDGKDKDVIIGQKDAKLAEFERVTGFQSDGVGVATASPTCCFPTHARCSRAWPEHEGHGQTITACERQNLLSMLRWARAALAGANITWYMSGAMLLGALSNGKSSSRIVEYIVKLYTSVSTIPYRLFRATELVYLHKLSTTVRLPNEIEVCTVFCSPRPLFATCGDEFG